MKAEAAIIKLLEDSDSGVRYAAVSVLGRMKAEAAVPDIVRCLADIDSEVRCKAIEALGKMKAEAAAPEIVNLLKDSDRKVRIAAVEALGKLKAKAAAQDIVRLMRDSDRDVQSAAAKAIGELKVDAVIPEIVNLLTYSDSNDRYVRIAAVEALRKLKAKSAVIINLLKDSDADVRSAAFYALGEMKVEEAVPEIVKLLTDSDSDVRHKAVFALGKMKAEAAVPEIVKLLTDSNLYVRSAAVKALGELKADTAVSEIARLLEDSNEEVRGRAIEAIGKLKADTATPEIIKLLAGSNSNDRYLRIAAVGAFGKLKADSVVPDIVKLLAGSDSFAQSAAASALGQLKADSAVPEIIKLIADSASTADVRRAAVSVLGELKADSAVHEIVRLLTDSNSEDVQLQAALALARMNHASPQFQAWREQAFKDAQEKIAANNADERKKAAQLLAPVFTAQAATLLAQLMDDADQDVAQEATKAIGFAAEFHPEWIPKDKLLALLKHPDLDMRETAVTSLGQLIAFRGEKKAADFSELDQRVRNTLSSLIKDQQQKTSIRATTIDALGDTGREECAQILFELLPAFDRSKEEALHSRCLFWLGRMNHAPARDYVEDELRKLEQAKAEWREQRDQNSGSIADKDDAWWQVREYRLGSALARIASAERGIALLGHPLHYVRQAAVRALAGKADADLIGKIIQAHQDFDQDELPSPFPYTAFQAIDLALWNLEYTGTVDDLQKLKGIKLESCKIPGQEGAIQERLEWTIERLKQKFMPPATDKQQAAQP
jgi:HEAT repeat protein